MGHVPHVYLPRPWDEDRLSVDERERRHLERVLRLEAGAAVSYTDGAGIVGEGRYAGGAVLRGEEEEIPLLPHALTMAVAPPRQVDRARFVVEKLGELGAERLVWITSHYGEGRPPRAEKSLAWAVAALQQSRGPRLLQIEGPASIAEVVDGLPGALVLVAVPGARPLEPALAAAEEDVVMCIGPEGGFGEDDLPSGVVEVGLGPRILRTETAAMVAATLILQALSAAD
ncbi:MAG: RsmE family RNA methyltransferase [Acidimicrobiia bacterium]|jgi:16S rRNA (uracil1498-N3)-methyltransferase